MWLKSWIKKVLSVFEKNSWVLMYHRVDGAAVDPWDLIVSPEKFEEQILWLKQNRNILPLDELVDQYLAGRLRKHSIAITFDDGYKDNFTRAAPMLKQYGVPATFFICTEPLFQQKAFWWDELQQIFLEADLPSSFTLTSAATVFQIELGKESSLTPELNRVLLRWRYFQPPSLARTRWYMEIWTEMRQWTHERRIHALQEWKEQLGITTRPQAMPMTSDDLKALGGNSIFTIGAHSVTHPALQYLNEEEQVEEMKKSAEALTRFCGHPVRTIAYPYGSYSQQTFALAKQAGFDAGFTTQTQAVHKAKTPLAIGRIMMTNTTDYKTVLK